MMKRWIAAAALSLVAGFAHAQQQTEVVLQYPYPELFTETHKRIAEEFAKGVKAAGGNVVGREFTNDKATDFTAILTGLKSKKPDVIFFGGMDAVAGPMLKQMKALGIQAKFMGGDGICTTRWPAVSCCASPRQPSVSSIIRSWAGPLRTRFSAYRWF